MADRPIIFSAPMVRALLDGRKTQTRRIYKVPPGSNVEHGRVWAMTDGCAHGDAELPYAPGDRLWVKETWRPSISAVDPWHVAVLYPHDGQVKHWGWSSDADFGDWTIPKAAEKGNVTPLFMPRWASRLTLTVTDVRVQRLQKITGRDIIAEGVRCDGCHDLGTGDYSACRDGGCWEVREAFHKLWNTLHGPEAWDANPWVCAITFTVHRCNIDQMGQP